MGPGHSLPVEGLGTIADALVSRKVHAPVVALRPYEGVEPLPAMPTLKLGDHACQYCHLQVNGKDLMLHMAFHIGRGEAVGVCPLCLFCGHTNGTCRLQMSKARSGDAHWQIAPTSCAHHCYRKTNMASLQKQVVHNEPLLCPVPGCGRWESRYNMPARLQVDDTHKEYPFTPEQKAKWEVPEEEKAVLQIGLTA